MVGAVTGNRLSAFKHSGNYLREPSIMALQHTIKAWVRKGVDYYVAECMELAVVTQGKTLDETLDNLREAIELHLDGENLSDFGLAANPTVLVTIEVELAGAQA